MYKIQYHIFNQEKREYEYINNPNQFEDKDINKLETLFQMLSFLKEEQLYTCSNLYKLPVEHWRQDDRKQLSFSVNNRFDFDYKSPYIIYCEIVFNDSSCIYKDIELFSGSGAEITFKVLKSLEDQLQRNRVSYVRWTMANGKEVKLKLGQNYL